jgi:hypothetical protein
MKHLIALSLSLLMVAPSAFGQTDDAPLPPGKPAGIHQAVLQSTENTIMIGMLVLGAAAAGILVSQRLKSSSTSAATTSTSP